MVRIGSSTDLRPASAGSPVLAPSLDFGYGDEVQRKAGEARRGVR